MVAVTKTQLLYLTQYRDLVRQKQMLSDHQAKKYSS